MNTPNLTTRVWAFVSRLRVRLNFDLPSVVDTLFPDPLVADDAFICPRHPVDERRTLSALAESSPRHLVVTK